MNLDIFVWSWWSWAILFVIVGLLVTKVIPNAFKRMLNAFFQSLFSNLFQSYYSCRFIYEEKIIAKAKSLLPQENKNN